MFLPTVADNGTGLSPFIRVQFDRDGSGRPPARSASTSPAASRSSSTRSSLTNYLSSSPRRHDPLREDFNPSLLVVRIPTEVTDAVGNPVTVETGGGVLAGIPEVILFNELTLPDGPETFADNALEDQGATGAIWASGLLAPGVSAGARDATVSSACSGGIHPSAPDTDGSADRGRGSDRRHRQRGGAAYPSSLTVTDGVFEFSKLIVEPGGRLPGLREAACGSQMRLLRHRAELDRRPVRHLARYDSLILAPQMGDVTAAAGGPGGRRGRPRRGSFRPRGSAVSQLPEPQPRGRRAEPGRDRGGLAGEGVAGGAIGGGSRGPLPAAFRRPTSPCSRTASELLGDTGFNVFGDPSPRTETAASCRWWPVPARVALTHLTAQSRRGPPRRPRCTRARDAHGRCAPTTTGGSNAGLGLAPPSPDNSGYTRAVSCAGRTATFRRLGAAWG